MDDNPVVVIAPPLAAVIPAVIADADVGAGAGFILPFPLGS